MVEKYILEQSEIINGLTPSSLVGYAGNERKLMDDNDQNGQVVDIDTLRRRRSRREEENISYSDLSEFFRIGGVDDLSDLVPIDFQEKADKIRIKALSRDKVQISDIEPLLAKVEEKLSDEERAGRRKNVEKLQKAKTAFAGLLRRLTSRGGSAAEVDETSTPSEPVDELTQRRRARQQKDQNQSQGTIPLAEHNESDIVEGQLKAQEKMQSFDSAEELFYYLSTGVDVYKWGAKDGTKGSNGKGLNDENIEGTFPLVTVNSWEIARDGSKRPRRKKGNSKEVDVTVNEENVMRFVRERINFYASESPYTAQVSFPDKLSFQVGARQVNLYVETVIKQGKLFGKKRVNGKEDDRLFRLGNAIAKELFAATLIRTYGVDIRQNGGGDPAQYVELLAKHYAENRLTDPFYDEDTSLMQFLATLPQNYTTAVDKDPETGIVRRKSDNKMGYAFLLMVETIMSLGDRQSLEALYPEGCRLLNFSELEKEVINVVRKDSRHQDPQKVLANLEKTDGQWKNAKKNPDRYMIDLVNLYNTPQKNNIIFTAVRNIINEMVAKRYDLTVDVVENGQKKNIVDSDNLSFAFLMAENFAYTTGIVAMLDVESRNFSGSKMFRTLRNRLRELRGRMRYSGAITTLNVFNETATPFFWASSTDGGTSIAEEFFHLREAADVTTRKLKKSKDNKNLTEEDKRKMEEKAQRDYKKQTENLSFGRNEQTQYIRDHLKNAAAVFDIVSSGKEIKWDDYTHFDDRDKQFTLKEKEFGEQVQNDILKKIYNMYSTWGKTDFTQKYKMQQEISYPKRDADGNIVKNEEGHVEYDTFFYYVEVPLAVAMFGREVLDVKPFWKMEEKYDRLTGKMKEVPVYNMFGEHEIDVKKVQKERKELVKSIFLNIVAGQVFNHRIKYGIDHRYGSKFYRSVITALRAIPEGEFRDPDNLQNNRPSGNAFNTEHIRWLRRKARITELHLFSLDLMRELRRPGKAKEVINEFNPIVKSTQRYLAA